MPMPNAATLAEIRRLAQLLHDGQRGPSQKEYERHRDKTTGSQGLATFLPTLCWSATVALAGYYCKSPKRNRGALRALDAPGRYKYYWEHPDGLEPAEGPGMPFWSDAVEWGDGDNE